MPDFSAMTDLTMLIEPDMRVYPGMAQPVINRLKEHPTHNAQVSQLVITVHAGTHVDAPRHFVAQGSTMENLDLSRLAGEAVLLDFTDFAPGSVITASQLAEAGDGIAPGDIVVLRTGYQKVAELENYCYLEPQAAEWLVEKQVKCFAGDIPSVDPINKTGSISFDTHPSHHILLRAGIPIVESLFHLEELKSKRFFFLCLPLKIADADGAPARAVAMELI